jgi:oxygen-independent coproporphyrinogen III oxidase
VTGGGRRSSGDSPRGDPGGFVAPASLYVHVPVCASKCAYCDFYSMPASALPEGFEAELVRATLDRASRLAERFGSAGFDTVYIGGGTPSMLSAPALDSLLRGIGALAAGPNGPAPAEWTVEANPDSLEPEKLDIMARLGVTRLSLGVQSLDEGELKLLGRRHGPEAALLAARRAAEIGMDVSADLIAGIPWPKGSARDPSDAGRLSSFAKELIGAGVAHVSVYDLSLEDGTPLSAAAGSLAFPDEDEEWEGRRRLEERLADEGMRRYEVSNYAAPGRECLHNLAYWRMDSYIGAGPGAVSTIAREDGSSLRIEEPKSVEGYAGLGGSPALETPIPIREAAFETIMMAFRTRFGLDLASFRKRFRTRAEDLIGETLSAWAPRIVAGEPWPSPRAAGAGPCSGLAPEFPVGGPALDGRGLDILNRFLGDCLGEMEGKPLAG